MNKNAKQSGVALCRINGRFTTINQGEKLWVIATGETYLIERKTWKSPCVTLNNSISDVPRMNVKLDA